MITDKLAWQTILEIDSNFDNISDSKPYNSELFKKSLTELMIFKNLSLEDNDYINIFKNIVDSYNKCA